MALNSISITSPAIFLVSMIFIHKKITLTIYEVHWKNNPASKTISFDLINLSTNYNLIQLDKGQYAGVNWISTLLAYGKTFCDFLL